MTSKTEEDFQELSAYERAGLEGKDPRCIPVKLDGPLPVGDQIQAPDYSPAEHAIWAGLYTRQSELLPGRASQEYLQGLHHLDLPPDRIPALAELSHKLQGLTDWRVARTPGLLHEQDFFQALANRIFPSTDYIRGQHELDYTPAPDCFHDIFGHLPMITNPDFADFYQEYGLASLRASGGDRRRLERFHWFTVEFGLLLEADQPRIYGNGIVSSYREVLNALGDEVERRPFDPEAMAEQEYEVWHLQPILYVVESMEVLKQGFRAWAGAKLGLL
ncbi:MAG: phenylalanine 4-monooxygenase [Candidatus Melainabacteria bacterium HGW-Melainabacteria-1]|nr:MAG: phenylalanine 4-monooxygenase [Candidatus Melainabacteria bacterium HGW-Melainabacteria-1]